MVRTRVLVLRAAGINCDVETAFAWELAGAEAERLHVNRWIERPSLLDDYQILTVPGGFSYGDDIAAGKILANQLQHHLGDAIHGFIDHGGLVMGICNGFQVLVRMGLLPGRDCGATVSLAPNDSGRYEDRWVHVRAEGSHCPFLEEGEIYRFPVAHAEGKVVAADGTAGATRLAASNRICLRYVDRDGGLPEYPENPNGSIENAAGLMDNTGRVLGIMPHPERHIFATHAPIGARDFSPAKAASPECDGARLFGRAVAYFS